MFPSSYFFLIAATLVTRSRWLRTSSTYQSRTTASAVTTGWWACLWCSWRISSIRLKHMPAENWIVLDLTIARVTAIQFNNFLSRVRVPAGLPSVAESKWTRQAGQFWGFCPSGRQMRWPRSLSSSRQRSGTTAPCSSEHTQDLSAIDQNTISTKCDHMSGQIRGWQTIVDKFTVCPKITCFNVEVFSGHLFMYLS